MAHTARRNRNRRGEAEKARMKAGVDRDLWPCRSSTAVRMLSLGTSRRLPPNARKALSLDQRLNPLIGDELDVGRPTPTRCRDEHREPVIAAPDGRSVHPDLLTGLGLKADYRLRRFLRFQRGEEQLQHRSAH